MIGGNVTENEPMIKGDWKTETNKVIAKNLVDNISLLLNAKVTRSTVVNSRGEVKYRIIIEYEEEADS